MKQKIADRKLLLVSLGILGFSLLFFLCVFAVKTAEQAWFLKSKSAPAGTERILPADFGNDTGYRII